MRINKIDYLKLMLLCFLCVGCSSVNDDTDNDSVERIVVGDDVPIFSVVVVDHGMLTTFSTGHLEGETVIVFFSTLCGDCKRDEDMVAPFWEEYGLEIPYSAQPDRRIYDMFAKSIVPRVYFVAPSGKVTKVLIENFDVGE